MEAGAAADYARRHELQARAAEEPCAEAVAKAAQQAERRGRSARGRAELARKVAIVKTMAAGRAAGLVAGPENPAGFGPQLTMAHQPGHAMPLDMPAGGFRNLGTVVGLNDPALGNLLSATNFVANGAAIFSFGSGSGSGSGTSLRSYIAFSDASAGYNASSDAVLEISGFSYASGFTSLAQISLV